MKSATFAVLLRALLCLWLAIGLVSCASMRTVIVDVDFDIQLKGRDATGREWQASPGEILKKRHPQAASPFGNVHYEGKLFELRVGVGPNSFGYFFRSNVGEPVCFRFDQARLLSNFQPKNVPLRVKRPRVVPDVKVAKLPINQGNEDFIVAPSVCAAPTVAGTPFGFVVDFSGLYPNGQLFNINNDKKSLDYTESGRGNWLKILVPIEYDGKRQELEVTLTAIDSKARFSYH